MQEVKFSHTLTRVSHFATENLFASIYMIFKKR